MENPSDEGVQTPSDGKPEPSEADRKDLEEIRSSGAVKGNPPKKAEPKPEPEGEPSKPDPEPAEGEGEGEEGKSEGEEPAEPEGKPERKSREAQFMRVDKFKKVTGKLKEELTAAQAEIERLTELAKKDDRTPGEQGDLEKSIEQLSEKFDVDPGFAKELAKLVGSQQAVSPELLKKLDKVDEHIMWQEQYAQFDAEFEQLVQSDPQFARLKDPKHAERIRTMYFSEEYKGTNLRSLVIEYDHDHPTGKSSGEKGASGSTANAAKDWDFDNLTPELVSAMKKDPKLHDQYQAHMRAKDRFGR